MNRLILFLAVSLVLVAAGRPLATGAESPLLSRPELEQRLHAAVNAARQRHGVPPLAWDETLAEIAREHSREMAAEGYLGHVDARGEGPTQRGQRAGYVCRQAFGDVVEEGLAENLFQDSLYRSATSLTVAGRTTVEYDWKTMAEIAEATVRGWLESEGHRHNLLHPRYAAGGVGVAVAADGKVYLTQLFC